jgi:PAS domain S-box-containing protein
MFTERASDRDSRFHETLVEVSPTAIVACDPAFIVTTWNPAAERLFGWTREEAIGRHFDELVARTTPFATRPPC